MTAITNNPEHIRFLIGEELKSIRFFNTLTDLGLDNSYFQPHLDESNATLDLYYSVMNEHAERIGIKEESVHEEAKAVFEKLSGSRK